MEQLIEAMQIKPPNLSARLRQVFRVEKVVGLHQLREIIEELIGLVKQHMPEIDTIKAIERLDTRVATWEGPPEGSS